MDIPVHVHIHINDSTKCSNEKPKTFLRRLRRHLYIILILISAISGFALGQFLRSLELSNGVHRLLALPGNLVIQGFTMLLIPLIACGIILGFSSLRLAGSSRMVVLTLALFFSLMIMASALACILANALRLGHHVTTPARPFTADSDTNLTSDNDDAINTIFDILQDLVPDNLVMASIAQKRTMVSYPSDPMVNDTDLMMDDGNNEWSREFTCIWRPNYIGLVVACAIIGCAMSNLGPKVSTIYTILEEVNLIVVKVMGYFIKVLPIGLFSWMCCQGLKTQSLTDMFSRIGVFLSAYVGLQFTFHLMVLPLLYVFIVRKNPLTFHLNLLPALLTAIGSASSSAAMPISLQCMEEKNKCHKSVTRFVLPLGSVVNMQGGALSTPLCVIFIAGMIGRNLGIFDTVIISVLSVIIQSAMPGIPSNGTMVGTLTILELLKINKLDALGLLMTVDWFLDRVMTMNNVAGDCYVAAYVEKLCRKSLAKEDGSIKDFLLDGVSLSSSNDSDESRRNSFRKNSVGVASIF